MASPFKVSSLTLTMCVGVEVKGGSILCGEEKAQLITETKVIAAIRRTRKRRLAIAPWLGIMDVVSKEVLERCGGRMCRLRKLSVLSCRLWRLNAAWSVAEACRLCTMRYDHHRSKHMAPSRPG